MLTRQSPAPQPLTDPLLGLILALILHLAPTPASAQAAEKETTMPPTLLFDEAEMARLRETSQTGWIAGARQRLQVNADKLMDLDTDPYHFHGSVSARAAQYQILTLAFQGLLTGKTAYADKGAEVLAAFTRDSSPETIAKLGGALAMGDATHALCIGYDWLYPHLSDVQRTAVRKQIQDFGDWLFTHSQTDFWGKDERRRQAHNWAAVTHGALGLAALTLADRPTWLDQATYQVNQYLQTCRDASGAPYEGMSYGAYGLQNAIPFVVALKRRTGKDLLAGKEGMLNAPDHLLWHVVPWGGAVVPINQSAPTLKPAGGMMHLISRSRSATGLWGWLRLLGPEGDGTYGWSSWLGDSVSLPYVVLFADPALEPRHPAAVPLPLSRHFARGQVAIRDGWQDTSSLVTFTCGEGIPGVWNQGDEGSFTFYALGEAFAVDCGAKRGRTSEHNAILVDGKGQRAEGGPAAVQGTITFMKDAGAWCMAVGDATQAYAGSAPVKRVIRSVVFIRNPRPILAIVDHVTTDGQPREVTWKLHSAVDNSIELTENGAVITGQRTGAVCDLIVAAPDTPNLALSETPARKGVFPAFTASTSAAQARFAVVMIPRRDSTRSVISPTWHDGALSLTVDGKRIVIREQQVSLH